MPFKKFDIPQSAEQVHFEVAGHAFICRPQIPAGMLLRLTQLGEAAEGAEGDEKKGKAVMSALMDFFKAALPGSGYERFIAVINDPDTVVPMETLSDIAGWMAEVYAGGRPTGATSSASSGSHSTGVGSTDGASPAQPIYSRSPQPAPSI